MRERGIGQSVPRSEDDALLRGFGQFVGDLLPRDAALLHVVRSPHAAARIRRIDAKAARAAPGVLAVLTPDVVAPHLVAPIGSKVPHHVNAG